MPSEYYARDDESERRRLAAPAAALDAHTAPGELVVAVRAGILGPAAGWRVGFRRL